MRGVCGVVSSREARPRDVEPPRVAPKYLVARVGPSTREVSLLGVSTDGSEAGASRGGGVSRLATSSDDRRRRRSVHGRVFRAPRARGGGACDGRSGEAHAPRRRDSPRAPPLPPGLERPRPRGALGFHVRPRARPDAPPRRPFGGARGVPRPRRPRPRPRARALRASPSTTPASRGPSTTPPPPYPTFAARAPSRAAATSSPRTSSPRYTRGASAAGSSSPCASPASPTAPPSSRSRGRTSSPTDEPCTPSSARGPRGTRGRARHPRAPHPSPHPLTPRRRPTSRTPRDPTPRRTLVASARVSPRDGVRVASSRTTRGFDRRSISPRICAVWDGASRRFVCRSSPFAFARRRWRRCDAAQFDGSVSRRRTTSPRRFAVRSLEDSVADDPSIVDATGSRCRRWSVAGWARSGSNRICSGTRRSPSSSGRTRTRTRARGPGRRRRRRRGDGGVGSRGRGGGERRRGWCTRAP